MSPPTEPRVFSIPPGVAFLPELASAILDGRLIPDFVPGNDPLALAAMTIYVPTRRAARELRSILTEREGGRPAILPTIRPLGEFDDDAELFDTAASDALALTPPIAAIDRLLLLAPLVKLWKSRLPLHLASLYEEDVIVPASTADAIWLARDLADLMDEIETEGADWTKLAGLVDGDLARWWQVTLEFLSIVTKTWPDVLAERDRSNPAAHRNALIDAEAARLRRSPPPGPVIAAGSTGSIPATARLLSAIAHLPNGAVVLPGLDKALDEASWDKIGGIGAEPASFGHPQTGLKKLIGRIGVARTDVIEIGKTSPGLGARATIIGEALRPAETTDAWAGRRAAIDKALNCGALDGVTLIEAANERDEAAAIAIALRRAVAARPDAMAALVTGDRTLARRVSAELLRFGIKADDSGGATLARMQPAVLFRLILETVFRPGDPVPIVSLLKHPLLRLGLPRQFVREACEFIELVALRGGTGRPDILSLGDLFETALLSVADDRRAPVWFQRVQPGDIETARSMFRSLGEAVVPLRDLRNGEAVDIKPILLASIVAFENCGRDENGSLEALYHGEEGAAFAEFLRKLLAAEADFPIEPTEWPDVAFALIAPESVKPRLGSDPRIHIWGTLEARLQSVGTLVLGGLNEGTFPGRTSGDRFLSRLMKGELSLEPPERRIGQAAHDFVMAMGTETIILTRSARSGDAPAVASRWLQRLTTVAGDAAAKAMRARGDLLLAWARALDAGEGKDFARRPQPTPPIEARPTHFSVTEIETLRRDPYAIHARKILKLEPLEPLIRDPQASERGSLFHDILHEFSKRVADPFDPTAESVLLDVGRRLFAEAELPDDINAVWLPRFEAMVPGLIAWERGRPKGVNGRHAEADALKTEVGETGVTLSGRADRIDARPAGMADILDYKTGTTPSKGQAHTLLSPQLALEGALMMRGSFGDVGKRQPSELAYVRLKPNGEVIEESILEHNRQVKSAPDLSNEAWERLIRLFVHYQNPATGYLSRAMPFREGETDGEYDHLARVLEWSAGGEDGGEGDGAA